MGAVHTSDGTPAPGQGMHHPRDGDAPRNGDAKRQANLRTAWILVSVAAVFFVGVIAAHAIGAGTGPIDVLGLVIIAFLVFAIGRHLRRGP